MANKRLIAGGLQSLHTADREVLGSEYEHKGRVYRYVKNMGSTALTRKAVCLVALTSIADNIKTRVIAPSGAGASTASVKVPAGMPLTAIGASGSSTGDHGWIQVEGPVKANVQQLTTELAVGDLAIASSSYDGAWASVHKPTADSASTSQAYARRVELLSAVATTGPNTAASAIIDIQCR